MIILLIGNEYQKNILKFLSPQCTATKEAQLTNATLGLTGESGEVKNGYYTVYDYGKTGEDAAEKVRERFKELKKVINES